MKLKFNESKLITISTPFSEEQKEINCIIISSITIFPQIKMATVQYYESYDTGTSITTYRIQTLNISESEYNQIPNFNERAMLELIKEKENINGEIVE